MKMRLAPAILAICVASCSGEVVPVQISLGVSGDQESDFLAVTTLEVTLSGPDRSPETIQIPLAASAPFASLDGLAVRTRFDLRLEGLDGSGARVFLGQRRGIEPPASLVLPVRLRNDFARTLGPMRAPRRHATAVRLTDGRVLIAGGEDPQTGQALASAETFDPSTATFSATGMLNHARSEHAATRLPDGRVLIAGGANGASFPLEVEIYDPGTGRFVVAGSLSNERASLTATAYSSGGSIRVLCAGGRGPAGPRATAEIYGVASSSVVDVRSLAADRAGHAAAALPDRVFLLGGNATEMRGEIFVFVDERLGLTSPMAAARPTATAAVTDDGRLLVSGPGDTVEALDPEGRVTPVATLSTAIAAPRLAAVPGGRALVVGDTIAFVITGTNAEPTFRAPDVGRSGHNAIDLDDGTILIAGGVGEAAAATQAEVFVPGGPP